MLLIIYYMCKDMEKTSGSFINTFGTISTSRSTIRYFNTRTVVFCQQCFAFIFLIFFPFFRRFFVRLFLGLFFFFLSLHKCCTVLLGWCLLLVWSKSLFGWDWFWTLTKFFGMKHQLSPSICDRTWWELKNTSILQMFEHLRTSA